MRLGLTQRELATSAGVSVRAVRYIEQGTVRQPRPQSIRSLAKTTGIDLGRLGPAAFPGTGARAGLVQLGVLGRLTVGLGDWPVGIGSLKQRCLLGLLALRANEVVSREEIVDVLWGASPPATCIALMHSYVSRLRQSLHLGRNPGSGKQLIAATNDGYRLTLRQEQLDLLRFNDLFARAKAAADDPEQAMQLLGGALVTWRGTVLADTTSQLWQHPVAIAATQRRLGAVLSHADHAIRLQRYDHAVEHLCSVVSTEPLHEGLNARLMLALAGSGQRAKALYLFTEIRKRLADELGIDPGADLRAAHLHILRRGAFTAEMIPLPGTWPGGPVGSGQ